MNFFGFSRRTSDASLSNVSENELLLLKQTLFNKDFSWVIGSFDKRDDKRDIINSVCSIINRISVEELASFFSWSATEKIGFFNSVYAKKYGVSQKIESAQRMFQKKYIKGLIKSFDDGTTDEFLGDLSYHDLLDVRICIENWNLFNRDDKFLSKELEDKCCEYLKMKEQQVLDKKYPKPQRLRTPSQQEKRERRPVTKRTDSIPSSDLALKKETKASDSDSGVVTNSDGSINITPAGIATYLSDVNGVRTRFNDALFFGGYFIEKLGDDYNVSSSDKALMLTEFALSSKSDSFEEVEEPVFNCMAGYLFDREFTNTKVYEVPVMGIIRDRAPLLYDKILYMKNLWGVTIPEYKEEYLVVLEQTFGTTSKEKDDGFANRAIQELVSAAQTGSRK